MRAALDGASLGGPFEHVISLGTFCYAGWLIKKLGLKQASYPFDWIFSNPAMVADILRDDFARFLDSQYHALNPPESRPSPHQHVAEHRFYTEQFGVEHIFSHRDVTDDDGKSYYLRCVERFRAVCSTSSSKLFLMIIAPNQGGSEVDFASICEWLDRNADNSALLAIQICRPPYNGNSDFTETLRIGQHRLLQFKSRSKPQGLEFADPADDAAIMEMIRMSV